MFHWEIHSGTQVNIWKDKWIPINNFNSLENLYNSFASKPTFNKVSDLINPDHSWKTDIISILFPQDIASAILSIHINGLDDTFVFETPDPSTKTFYNHFLTLPHPTSQKPFVSRHPRYGSKFGNFQSLKKSESLFGNFF